MTTAETSALGDALSLNSAEDQAPEDTKLLSVAKEAIEVVSVVSKAAESDAKPEAPKVSKASKEKETGQKSTDA